MCIPADSMLWALVTRIREDGYVPTARDFAALIGSGCSRARIRDVFAREAAASAAFRDALVTLEQLGPA
jgi:hypothetical protein